LLLFALTTTGKDSSRKERTRLNRCALMWRKKTNQKLTLSATCSMAASTFALSLLLLFLLLRWQLSYFANHAPVRMIGEMSIANLQVSGNAKTHIADRQSHNI